MAKLPAEVVALFESSKVSRADKTKLANSVVTRDADGKFELNLEAPVLSMLQAHYTDISGSHKAKGYPKSLIVAKCGGELAFSKALEAGEIRETEQDGQTFYFFNTITIEKKVGARAETAGKVAKEADDAQIGALSAFVESFQPTFREIPGMAASSSAAMLHPGVNAVPAGMPSASLPLALMDKPAAGASEIQLDFCGVATLDAAVLAKIDEGLGWWKSLREQARKVLEKPSKPAQEALRKQMGSRMAEVFQIQVMLEQFKTFGAKDPAKLRSTMSEFAAGLMSVQEMVKGLQAMN
eukprot:s2334_g5.t1